MSSLFEPFDPLGTLPEHDDEFAYPIDERVFDTKQGDVLEQAPIRPLLWPFKAGLLLIIAVIIARLSTLQLIEGPSNRVLAEGNRVRTRPIEAPRGLILDRAGRSLATNRAGFSLELTPADLPRNSDERRAVYEQLAPIVGIDQAELKQRVERAGLFSLDAVVLLGEIAHERALELELALGDLPGVAVTERAIRQYDTVGTQAHLLGYLGKITTRELEERPTYHLTDLIGKSGVERTHDRLLRGTPGVQAVEVDSKGRTQRSYESQAPVPGQQIVLGVDRELQQVAADALRAMLTERQAQAGVVVGLDPRDGTVRLMVSVPDYDNNQFSQRISQEELTALTSDPLTPLTNRAIAGVYPPGSTLKPLVATAGLAEGVISPSTTIDAPAEIRIGDFVFPDWKRHGLVDVRRAIAVSSNVFFYAVGGGWDRIGGLGIERLDNHLETFGLGATTKIDLAGEVAGLVPTPAWKRERMKQSWYIGDTYHLAIGQGDLLATPIQMANAVSAIANNGTLWQPRLVEATIDPVTNTRTPLSPQPLAESIEPESALKVVREGMRQTVLEGSARTLNELPVAIAGKTGTAQFGLPINDQGETKTHAWFVSFAPYDQPELVLLVMVEGGGEGHATAVPVARTIYQWLIDHGFGSGELQD